VAEGINAVSSLAEKCPFRSVAGNFSKCRYAMHDWHKYTELAIALFVIADPVGAVPIFLGLTASQPKKDKRHTALVAAATVAAVLVLAAFLGAPSFRVAGGILILMMAVAMLYSEPGAGMFRDTMLSGKHDLAAVPLGVPLIAGPGAISSVIVYAQQATAWFDTIFLAVTILFVAASVWLALRLAEPISAVLGRNGINVITRLLGLLLAAIAIEFVTSGLVQLLPGLAAC
jgi:multiple antibiotic resistance protein